MRFRLPLVLLALAMFALTATTSQASLSVVLDADGNRTNGPDTLLIAPADTISIDIWITGSDSVHAFGVTIGDTTGALTWLPEIADSIYMTPSSWTPVSVQGNEDSTWLTIQSTDFTGTAPIHAPVKVADMKFVVTPGESCGTFLGNSEQSGWFNADLGDTIFVEFEGPTICVTEVASGGESASGPGGSGDDRPTDGRPTDGSGGGESATAGSCAELPCCTYDANKPATNRRWVVDDDGTIGIDCDCNVIQACIDSASAGDTVCVNPGDYTELFMLPYDRGVSPPVTRYATHLAAFTLLKDSLVIKGIAGPDYTRVGYDTTDAAQNPVVHGCVLAGDTTGQGVLEAVILEGFTFHSGYSDQFTDAAAYGAGAMICRPPVTSSVIIRNNVFEFNSGIHGGAIRTYGEPAIRNNVFRHNRMTGGGGQGGAIQVSKAPGGITRPEIVGNQFVDNGWPQGSTLQGLGGAIAYENGGGNFENNHVYRCRAKQGGAIYLQGADDIEISGNTISQCSSSEIGGAIIEKHIPASSSRVMNNTFVLNSSGDGAAFYSNNANSSIVFTGNIVAYSEGGLGFVADTAFTWDPATDTFSCNDFFANNDGDWVGIPDSLLSDIILDDPIFCESNPCSLLSIHPSSPCAAGNTCSDLIGARGTCASCVAIQTAVGSSSAGNPVHEHPIAQLSPNPATTRISFVVNPRFAGNRVRIEVFDVTGRRFSDRILFRDAGSATELGLVRGVDFPAVPGVYFVRAKSEMQVFVQKVVVVK